MRLRFQRPSSIPVLKQQSNAAFGIPILTAQSYHNSCAAIQQYNTSVSQGVVLGAGGLFREAPATAMGQPRPLPGMISLVRLDLRIQIRLRKRVGFTTDEPASLPACLSVPTSRAPISSLVYQQVALPQSVLWLLCSGLRQQNMRSISVSHEQD